MFDPYYLLFSYLFLHLDSSIFPKRIVLFAICALDSRKECHKATFICVSIFLSNVAETFEGFLLVSCNTDLMTHKHHTMLYFQVKKATRSHNVLVRNILSLLCVI